MADATYQPKVYKTTGGNVLEVGSGGTIEINTGAVLSFNAVDQRAALATAPAAVAAGYKLARGLGTLDGTNPTPVITGLATVVSIVTTLSGTAAPGDITSVMSAAVGASGTAQVYAWMNTAGTDPTLVASTGTEIFNWIAIGT